MAITPTLLSDTLTEVLACACTILENGLCDEGTKCGCPCRMFVSAGPPVWDLEACCSDGQLSAYISRIYPHGNFPSQAAAVNLCQVPLAAEVVVTLLRCYPAVVRDDGSAPYHTEINEAAVDIYRDLYLLTTGLICCLKQKGRKQKYVLNSAQIVGPQGGCVGAEVRFTIELVDPLP